MAWLVFDRTATISTAPDEILQVKNFVSNTSIPQQTTATISFRETTPKISEQNRI
jgi:hypothetical protein